MVLRNIIDRLYLFFQNDKDLRRSLFEILGFYPHNIEYYRQALMHKSIGRRNDKGKPLNNERLEFLGDAILDAAVGHIVYRHYEGKREGFLTNTRSKLVSRETLGKLANEMGLSQLILSAGHSNSHNSYVGGNAFEALVGAIYLDRGYDTCMWFWENRVLGKYINLDKVAFKEVNFKSKLLEWSQKNKVRMEYRMLKQKKDDNGSPVFSFQVLLEGVEGEKGSGYSKKEAQQLASKDTLQKLKREPQFIDAIFKAKSDRTKMEEEPTMSVPDPEKEQQDFLIRSQETVDSSQEDLEEVFQSKETSEISEILSDDDLDLSHITHKEKSREDIIAEAEAAAFAED
jgi:ribonuclease-3